MLHFHLNLLNQYHRELTLPYGLICTKAAADLVTQCAMEGSVISQGNLGLFDSK